jgi:tetratricopeptide (TPR) repeat protein
MGRRKRAIAERRAADIKPDEEAPASTNSLWVRSGMVQGPSTRDGSNGLFPTRRGVLFTTLGLFVVGLAMRVSFLVAHLGSELVTLPVLDAAAYLSWANDILNGVGRPLGAFFTEPGYAYLIAASLALFGSYMPILWLQVVLGSTVPPLIYIAARKIFKRDAPAIIAAVLIVFLRSGVFHDALLLKTSLELWLMSLLIAMLAYTWNDRSVSKFFATGLLIGVTALIKANVLYVLPLLVIGLLVPKPMHMKQTLSYAAALVAGAVLMVSPATLYNLKHSGSFIPVNYSGGVTVYIGNWEMADGSFMVPEYFSLDPEHEEESWHALAEAFAGKELTAAETSSFWLREGIREALANPGHTVQVNLKKLYLLFAGNEIADNYPVSYGELRFPLLRYLLPFWLIALLGLVGAVVYARKEHRHPVYLYALFAGYAGLIVMSKVAERYRLALVLILVLFAGYAVYQLWSVARQKGRKAEVALYAMLLASLGTVLATVQPIVVTTGEADLYSTYGAQYLEESNLEKAEEMFTKGIVLSPLHEPLLQQLGKTQLFQGRAAEALETYRDALRARADGSTFGLEKAYTCMEEGCTSEEVLEAFDALENKERSWSYQEEYLEGMRAIRRGEDETAIEKFLEAYERNPGIRGLKSNIALIYGRMGEQLKAQEYLLEAADDNHFDIIAHYNLGNAYSRASEYERAIPHYEWVAALVPDFNLVRYNLGRAYMYTENFFGAHEELTAFIEYAESRNLYPNQVSNARNALVGIDQEIMRRLAPSAG